MLQDAHKTALSHLCANVAERHAKGLGLLTEANDAPDMGTVKAKLSEALSLLSDTTASIGAIVQTATVMATGEMLVQAAEKPAEADPVPAAPSSSAEAADAAPASSSDVSGSTEATGDVATDDGSAGKRKR